MRLRRLAALFAGVCIVPLIAIADTTFKVSVINPPIPFDGVQLSDVSSNGQIIGTVQSGSIDGGNFRSAPFAATKSKIKLLRTPPFAATNYVATRVNDNGTIVGYRLDTNQAVAWTDRKKLPRALVPSSLRSKVIVGDDGQDLRFNSNSNSLTNSGILVGSYVEGTAASNSRKGFTADIAERMFVSSPRPLLGLSENGIALEQQNSLDPLSFGAITNFNGAKERRRRVRGSPQQLAIARDGRLFGSIPTGSGGTRCAVWKKPTGVPTTLVSISKPGGICLVTSLAGNHAIGRYDSDVELEGDFRSFLYIDIKKNETTTIPSTVTDSLGRTYTDIQPVKVLENGTIFANAVLTGGNRIITLTPRR